MGPLGGKTENMLGGLITGIYENSTMKTQNNFENPNMINYKKVLSHYIFSLEVFLELILKNKVFH